MDINKDKVLYGDVFLLYYYGIRVFFGVNYTAYDWISVYELQSLFFDHHTKEYFVQHYPKRQSSCLVISPFVHNGRDENSDRPLISKTFYDEKEKKEYIEIKITKGMPLFQKALKKGKNPIPGVYKAYRVLDEDGLVPYWYYKVEK